MRFVIFAVAVYAAKGSISTADILKEVYGDLADLADFLSIPDPLDNQALALFEEETSDATPQQYNYHNGFPGVQGSRFPSSDWAPEGRPSYQNMPHLAPILGQPGFPTGGYGGNGNYNPGAFSPVLKQQGNYFNQQGDYNRQGGYSNFNAPYPDRPEHRHDGSLLAGGRFGSGEPDAWNRGNNGPFLPSFGGVGGYPRPRAPRLKVPQEADITNVVLNSLEAFVGRWECDMRSSRPADNVLSALGVAPLKIRILDNHAPVTTIHMASPDVLRMENRLPGGTSVGGDIPIDGSEFVHTEQETGSWRSVASFEDGKLVQVRNNPRGTMYDVRAVYDRQPQTGAVGPWMLFKWSYQPNGGALTSTDRWLRKAG